MVFMFYIYSEIYCKIKYTTYVLLKSNNLLYLPVYNSLECAPILRYFSN